MTVAKVVTLIAAICLWEVQAVAADRLSLTTKLLSMAHYSLRCHSYPNAAIAQARLWH